jgi:peroxiredoxin
MPTREEIVTIKTGLPLPSLELPLVGGGSRRLGDPDGARFVVLVFYRGSHCRRCNPYLNRFQSLLAEFDACGAEVIAVSADERSRAERSVAAWGLDRLKVAYQFPLEAAPDWGLYVTERGKPEDPPLFTEPALFVVGPDGRLDHGIINTAQRLRPNPDDVLAHLRDRIEEAANPTAATAG